VAIIAPWLRPADVLGAIQEGGQLGESMRSETERERADKANEGLEGARLADAASNEGANRALQSSEDALAAKAAVVQQKYAMSEKLKQDALNQEKADRPDIVTTPGGGVLSIDPKGNATTIEQANDKPIFSKAGNKLFQFNPLTKSWEQKAEGDPTYSGIFGSIGDGVYTLNKQTGKAELAMPGTNAPPALPGATPPAPKAPGGFNFFNPMTYFGGSAPAPAPDNGLPPAPPSIPSSVMPSPLGIAPAQPVNTAPKKGDVVGGYVFKGGDPADESNWTKQ
jgi:hypothetical protein